MTKITRSFHKTQLRNVLIDIDPDREPEMKVIEFIMHRLHDENGEVQANKIGIVIVKYRKYMKQKDRYDSLTKKFDTNDSGKLDKAQLLAMLQEVARGRVSVDEDDVNRVMEAADQDKSGDIDANEMKVAVAEWDQTYKQNSETAEFDV